MKKGQDCGIFFSRHKNAVSKEPSSDSDEDSDDDEETQILPNDVLLVYTVEEKPRKVGEPRRVI